MIIGPDGFLYVGSYLLRPMDIRAPLCVSLCLSVSLSVSLPLSLRYTYPLEQVQAQRCAAAQPERRRALGSGRRARGAARRGRCASPALSPLPLMFPYKSEKSLCGTGLAFAPDGALYVSSYEDSRVVRFNVSEAGHGSTGASQRLKPWEAGRRRAAPQEEEDTLRQSAGEDEGDEEASRRQQQIERMLEKLKEGGAEAGVQQARRRRKGKSTCLLLLHMLYTMRLEIFGQKCP